MAYALSERALVVSRSGVGGSDIRPCGVCLDYYLGDHHSIQGHISPAKAWRCPCTPRGSHSSSRLFRVSNKGKETVSAMRTNELGPVVGRSNDFTNGYLSGLFLYSSQNQGADTSNTKTMPGKVRTTMMK